MYMRVFHSFIVVLCGSVRESPEVCAVKWLLNWGVSPEVCAVKWLLNWGISPEVCAVKWLLNWGVSPEVCAVKWLLNCLRIRQEVVLAWFLEYFLDFATRSEAKHENTSSGQPSHCATWRSAILVWMWFGSVSLLLGIQHVTPLAVLALRQIVTVRVQIYK
jgi:hypothetical protein